MRGGLVLASLGAAALVMGSSCTRINPAYEGGGDTSSGSASSSSGTMTDGLSTSLDGSGGATDSDGTAVCGDGKIGPGEECDDGNAIDGDGCSASCQLTAEVDWLVEFEPVSGALHAFMSAAQLEGDLLAAGRARLAGEPEHRAVVVRFDRETGAEVEVAALEGDWLQSEAFGLVAAPPRLYIAGTVQRPDSLYSAMVACFDVGETLSSASCWTTLVDGGRGRGLVLHEATVITALSRFDEAGYGVGWLDEAGGATTVIIDSLVGRSQFDAVAVVGGAPVVGGMVEADAAVFPAGPDFASSLPLITVAGMGPGRDRVQAMVAVGEDLVLGGWLDQEGTGRDAWAGRFGTDGTERWSWSLNGGSLDADEIEALALSPEGHVIGVGMMGNPSAPRVWKIDPESGDVIWSRTYSDLGPNDAFFRGVVVDEAIFVVGERRVVGGSVGIAARIPL